MRHINPIPPGILLFLPKGPLRLKEVNYTIQFKYTPY